MFKNKAAMITVAVLLVFVMVVTASLIHKSRTDVEATVDYPNIKVYIRGEVKTPGLYEIEADVRLIELIELAGGPTENADLDRLNLAAILQDGKTVKIPAVGEEEESPEVIEAMAQTDYEEHFSSGSDKIASGTVNINSAGKEELMRLPGVGEATAVKIINYRETAGGFNAIEEIMNVSGIGESKFSSMKPFLSVE